MHKNGAYLLSIINRSVSLTSTCKSCYAFQRITKYKEEKIK